MSADEIRVQVRAADTSSSLTVIRALFSNRQIGSVAIEGTRIRYDIPDDMQRALYVQRTPADNGGDTKYVIPLHRPGLVGVAADWENFEEGNVTLLVVFHDSDSAARSRKVEPRDGSIAWFAPPPHTDGVSLVLVLEGSGEVNVRFLEIIVPSPWGWMPTGRTLDNALELGRFPEGATSWIETPESEVIGDRRVRVGSSDLSLEPPVDWELGPLDDRTFQLALHGFNFADAVLASEASERATWMADVFEDWIQKHPSRPHSTTEMAWNDMSVASRTVGLLRVIDRLRSTDPLRAASLAEAAAQHARWLAHDRNYMKGHDHGLYSDTALDYAARSLSSHTLASRWRRRAHERMAQTSESVVCEVEGTILEHSPAYVEKVAALLAHRRRNHLRDSLPADMVNRFEETLSIVTTPCGRLLPWGDTGHHHVSRRRRPNGAFAFTRTGWGVSQLANQTAAISAAYHSSAHKHGDDLSVLLYDADGPVVTEAGFPGYGYRDDEFRIYGTSERAHNSVIINDEVAEWKKAERYGSAVWNASENQGWHLLGGWNPMQSAGSHIRFILHSDGVMLVADLLTGPEVRSVERLFHIDKRLELGTAGNSEVEFKGWSLTNWTEFGSSEISLLPEGEQTRHFPVPGVVSHHHVVRLRDSFPGLRVMTMTRPDASFAIATGIVTGTDTEVRIHLETTSGGSASWSLTNGWSGSGGRLHLSSVLL